MVELDPSEPTVLLIGNVDSEGILSTLKASGRQYKVKRIDSSAENWATICDQFDLFPVRCALVKLTSATYGYLASPDYTEMRENLLGRLASVPNAVFAYETLLSSADDAEIREQEAENDTYWGYGYGLPPVAIRNAVNNLLADRGLEVIPYRRNAEVTVLASAFLADAEDGLLFRVYVPSGMIWANETDRLLQLFRDYLSRVGHQTVRLDQRRTGHGIVYELYAASGGAQTATNSTALSREFEEFSKLLDLTVSDPAQAEALLRGKDVDPREIAGILTRYAKEARRLQVDLRQEREQKLLSVRHRLESELADVLPASADLDSIGVLVDAAVPRAVRTRSALIGEQRLLPSTTQLGNVTINIRPQIVNAVNAAVAHEINGDVNLTENDQRLLELIAQHGGDRAAQLTSAVRELADESAPKPGRLRARQRIKGFLLAVASKVPDLAVGVLQSYIENRMGL